MSPPSDLIHRARDALAAARRLSVRGLDALLPPVCPITGDPVEAPGRLSAAGWAALRFVDDPACARCGVPFAVDHGAGAECGACLAAPPAFDRARAAVVYDEASHRLVIAFKHSDRTELAPMFGAWLARAARDLAQSEAVLAPVPLHWRRLAGRRYNQAALLADAAARALGLRCDSFLLARTRPTPPQKQLSATERRRNVASAFAVRPQAQASVRGGHFILVDDVLTTGATLSSCARALKRAGATRVEALVLARVVKGLGGPI